MCKIYILHEINEKIKFDKIKKNDILTFDDAHFSIYKYKDKIQNIECFRKIIFITPNFISMKKRECEPKIERYYMDDFFLYNKRDQFLTIHEIEELYNIGFELGSHSFFHDIVYIPRGKNNFYQLDDKTRKWYYKDISNHNLLKLFQYVSALSEKGINRTESEFKEYIEQDTYLCTEWFKKYFSHFRRYAYPFFQTSKYLEEVLKKYDYEEIYGRREDP